MDTWIKILQFLDTDMETPTPYGWFHLLWLALTVLATVFLCVRGKKQSPKQIRNTVLGITIVCILLEIYKQINYTFRINNGGLTVDFQWYAFPWQFCSIPVYVGLLAGLIRKGKIHSALCAFLATYSIFAGVCVMVYPVQVFIRTIGINMQTMVWHGSMIAIGIYLLYTGYVKITHKTILKALPVFLVAALIAMVLNEIAYRSGLLETETFNMFYFSPYCEPSLPVYSIVQAIVPYPWCLILYIGGFTLAAYIILLIAIGIKRIFSKRVPKEAVAIQ